MPSLPIRVAAAVAVALLGLSACKPAAPKAAELRDPVAAYLLAYKKRSCAGEVSLERLEIRRVGAWEKSAGGGFPVYADFAVTCREARLTSTFTSADGAQTGAATCWANRRGSAWNCAMPAVFAEAEAEMKRQLDEAMRKLPK
jgi:hypothetical protein